MQTRFKRTEGAYLTVYLSLVFGIVLSLLLALIEGAAIGAVRAQAEIVADLGLDSVFAEYHRELLNQYEVFFVDASYGSGNGGVGKVEARLKDYMCHNMDPDKDLSLAGASTLLKLDNPYLEIEEASYASDGNGAVWKAQAVNYMKSAYGGDLISTVKGYLDTVNGNALATRDIAAETADQKRAFEETLKGKEIVEYGAESEEGYSYSKVSGMFDSLIGGGILTLVMPEGSSLSGASVNKSQYLSERMKANKVNKGIGLHEGAKAADGVDDELVYGEYLMKMCGNYADVKEEGLLKYQIEYILYGKESDVSNLRACAERLYALRAVSNLIYLSQDGAKRGEAKAAATVICTLLLVPELSETLAAIILGVWALAESAVDVRSLLDGGKAPLLKKSGDWNLGISGIFKGWASARGKNTGGLSYQDYLRIFLMLMDKKDKALRNLDIVEMDIRQTQGNEDFKIDRCIDYMKVSFGFADAQGHDFVFSKKMCYE